MSNIKDLKKEADDLGISYHVSTGAVKLQAKIDAHYEQALTPPVEAVQESTVSAVRKGPKEWTQADRVALAQSREREARKTVIVTIVDNDTRVNNQATTVMATCSSLLFDLGKRIIPLNMEVEVTLGHLSNIMERDLVVHLTDPTTGLGVMSTRKRYNVSYSDKKPS